MHVVEGLVNRLGRLRASTLSDSAWRKSSGRARAVVGKLAPPMRSVTRPVRPSASKASRFTARAVTGHHRGWGRSWSRIECWRTGWGSRNACSSWATWRTPRCCPTSRRARCSSCRRAPNPSVWSCSRRLTTGRAWCARAWAGLPCHLRRRLSRWAACIVGYEGEFRGGSLLGGPGPGAQADYKTPSRRLLT
jgi:hypothetical protein